MPEMDDATVRNIIETIDEVAYRSYRIREWWNLESHLRKVENSFKPFITTLRRVPSPQEFGVQASTLTEHWTVCQLMDLPEISSFAYHLEHIHLPIEPGSSNYPNPQVGIAALVEFGNSIQKALNDGLYDELKRQSEGFQHALAGQLANRKAIMNHEVERLCQVIYMLRASLK